MITKRDYENALLVQEATNLNGVVSEFVSVIEKLSDTVLGDKITLNQHPLAVMYTSKILSLTNNSCTSISKSNFIEPSWRLALLVHCMHAVLQALNHFSENSFGFNVDNSFKTKDDVIQFIAIRMAELTHCESIDVFGVAYEACQHVAQLTPDDADEELNADGWLHQVVVPPARKKHLTLPVLAINMHSEEDGDVLTSCLPLCVQR